jgi:hypothetical protein
MNPHALHFVLSLSPEGTGLSLGAVQREVQ